MAFLASDNTSGASPEIIDAIRLANDGYAKAYGADAYTQQLTAALRAVFDHDTLLAFPVFNGSAANCLGLASVMRPYEAAIVHEHSHLQQSECGMPEFFTGGKLLQAKGEHGKIDPASVEHILKIAHGDSVHHSRPKAISITQSTEFGTVYTAQQIAALSQLARDNGLLLHMDGARFANAVAHIGCAPSQLSWQVGVDILSFGCTKNGAVLAESVIFFKPELARDFTQQRKRAGQLASKQRFISAQMLAMLQNDLWLRNASHANAMATRLYEGLSSLPHIAILNRVEANALFVQMPAHIAGALAQKGHEFFDWPLLGDDVYRLVTSFSTDVSGIDAFVQDAQAAARA